MGYDVTTVQKALKGADYPASKDDLVSKARDNGADDDLVSSLESMSKDSFDGPTAVMQAMKGDLGGD